MIAAGALRPSPNNHHLIHPAEIFAHGQSITCRTANHCTSILVALYSRFTIDGPPTPTPTFLATMTINNRGAIIDVIKDRSNTTGVEWKTVAILVTTAIWLVRKGYIILIENSRCIIRRDGGYLVANYLCNRIGLDRAAACCHTETVNSDIMESSTKISCKYIDIDCGLMLTRLIIDYC